MSIEPKYKQPLPPDTTLCVYKDDELLFSSCGKWLHPVFDFGIFLKDNNISLSSDNVLSAHDTFIGKGAAYLMIKSGITKIHGNTVSQLALDYVSYLNDNGYNLEISYNTLVPRLLCKTEDELENVNDSKKIDELLMARLLK